MIIFMGLFRPSIDGGIWVCCGYNGTYMQLKMPPAYLVLICLAPISNSLESLLALLQLDRSSAFCSA